MPARQAFACKSVSKTTRLDGRSAACRHACSACSRPTRTFPSASTSFTRSSARRESSLFRYASSVKGSSEPARGITVMRLSGGSESINSAAFPLARSNSVPPSDSVPMLRLLSTTRTACTGACEFAAVSFVDDDCRAIPARPNAEPISPARHKPPAASLARACFGPDVTRAIAPPNAASRQNASRTPYQTAPPADPLK